MPTTPRSILYLAPTFLSYRLHKQIRGVEVFDLLLVRQLVSLGHHVTLPADHTWKKRLSQHLAGALPTIVYTPPLLKPTWNALAAGALLKRRAQPFDVTFLGNVARGMIPGVNLMHKRGLIGRLVVQSNRPPRDPMAHAIVRWNARVLAVSAWVRDQSPDFLRDRTDIYYGIADPQSWTPPTSPRPDTGNVKFCVVGALRNAWKGADLAIEAFGKLPPAVRAKCELHLASYPKGKTPPQAQNIPGVTAYEWMPTDKMPGFLRSMDVMLQPSTSNETFCQSMVQGMLTELPVLAYDLPPLTEKLDTGGGLTFRSTDELAAQMALYAADHARRLHDGRHARRVALERYIWDTETFLKRYLLP